MPGEPRRSRGSDTGAEERLQVQTKLHLPLTSCHAAWFLTGHSLVLVHGPGVGTPDLGDILITTYSFVFFQNIKSFKTFYCT